MQKHVSLINCIGFYKTTWWWIGQDFWSTELLIHVLAPSSIKETCFNIILDASLNFKFQGGRGWKEQVFPFIVNTGNIFFSDPLASLCNAGSILSTLPRYLEPVVPSFRKPRPNESVKSFWSSSVIVRVWGSPARVGRQSKAAGESKGSVHGRSYCCHCPLAPNSIIIYYHLFILHKAL